MCDTLVALGNSTENGDVIFGKNSDRPPNEAQLVEFHPSKEYDEGETLQCTHISIPQVKRTYAVFLSRPHWMWGAEMGANELGVVIGNEAVFSKDDVPDSGLLGMDLLRLGLERGKDAREALDVIVTLLEEHGQGGVCELNGVMTYHNSYIIADSKDAWVLETSSRRWIAEKVKNVRSISNGYTIQGKGDLASSDLIEHAVEMAWIEDKESFNFLETYGNEMMRFIAMCDPRLQQTSESLNETRGNINFLTFRSILTSHPPEWSPWVQEIRPICQHSYPGSRDSSAGSQISELGKNLHWLTGSSNPCQSVYLPFRFDTPYIYDGWNRGAEQFSDDSFWWRRELVNRRFSVKNEASRSRLSSYLEELQSDIHTDALATFEPDVIQRNITELERYIEELLLTSDNATDIDEEYVQYLKTIIEEADVPQNYVGELSNLF